MVFFSSPLYYFKSKIDLNLGLINMPYFLSSSNSSSFTKIIILTILFVVKTKNFT